MKLVFVPEFLGCELEIDLILQSSEPAVFLFPRVCLCWIPALTMDHGQASRWVGTWANGSGQTAGQVW